MTKLVSKLKKERDALFRVGDVLLMPVRAPRIHSRPIAGEPTPERVVLVTSVDLVTARAEYAVIGADGYTTGEYGSFYFWDADSVKHIEGAKARQHVTLPPEWKQRAIDYDKSQLAKHKDEPDSRDYSETHPSYGSARVSRVSCGGGGGNLFMSAFNHQNYITLGVSRAQLSRTHSNQWMHSALGSDLIELAFSESQWALLLSSVGGSAVPATITRVHGQLVQSCPPQNDVKRFHTDVEERMARATEHLAQAVTRAREVAEAPSATKADRRDVAAMTQAAQRELLDGLPFVVEMLRERMETLVDEAKAQVELHLRLAQGERQLTAGVAAGAGVAPIATPETPAKELP